MRAAALILSAALCGPAVAEFWDGNALWQRLTGNTSQELVAMGYIMGVADAGHSVEHCPPPNVTSGQILDMVKQHLERNPAIRNRTADTIVLHVLRNQWPCANNNRRGSTGT